MNVTIFRANIQGSGDFITSGSAMGATLIISGSGDIHGKDLNTTNASVQVSGSGDVAVHCSNELSVVITGSGDVTYSGKPHVKRTISGGGSKSINQS
jgi:Putative auto-transporter adhesin, head GIN domain